MCGDVGRVVAGSWAAGAGEESDRGGDGQLCAVLRGTAPPQLSQPPELNSASVASAGSVLNPSAPSDRAVRPSRGSTGPGDPASRRYRIGEWIQTNNYTIWTDFKR